MQQPEWATDWRLFRPKWSFLNAFENPTQHVHKLKLQYVSELGGHVCEKFKFQGRFTRKMSLHRFPFDRQDLGIKISGEQPLERQQWSSLCTEAGKPTASACPPEWRSQERQPHLEILPSRGPSKTLQQVRISIYVQRNPWFFLTQVVLMTFFLCLAAAAAKLVEPEQVGERAAILLTVLLDLTRLDWYSLFAFLLQFGTLLESCLVVRIFCKDIDDSDGTVDGEFNASASGHTFRTPPAQECVDAAGHFDEMFFYGAFGLWIASHAFFVLSLVLAHARNVCQRRSSSPQRSVHREPQRHPYGMPSYGSFRGAEARSDRNERGFCAIASE